MMLDFIDIHEWFNRARKDAPILRGKRYIPLLASFSDGEILLFILGMILR